MLELACKPSCQIFWPAVKIGPARTSGGHRPAMRHKMRRMARKTKDDPLASQLLDDFATRMRGLREGLRLTQEQFGELVGRSRSAVDQWEDAANFARPPELFRMYRRWGVTADFMLFGKDDTLRVEVRRWLVEIGVLKAD